MPLEHKTALILSVLLLSLIPLTFSNMNFFKEDNNEIVDTVNTAALSDDEISYALSELSVDDLKTLSKLIDVFSQEGEIKDKNDFNSQDMSEELTRFKREISDTSAKQDNLISNVNEGYIRQLEDSFPNIIDQPNQEEKEKNHIRVKRD